MWASQLQDGQATSLISMESKVFGWTSFPFYGRTIQVSELLSFAQIGYHRCLFLRWHFPKTLRVKSGCLLARFLFNCTVDLIWYIIYIYNYIYIWIYIYIYTYKYKNMIIYDYICTASLTLYHLNYSQSWDPVQWCSCQVPWHIPSRPAPRNMHGRPMRIKVSTDNFWSGPTWGKMGKVGMGCRSSPWLFVTLAIENCHWYSILT